MLDEQRLERRLVELEVGHRRAAIHGGGEDRVGFDAVGELELGPVNAGSDERGRRAAARARNGRPIR